MSAAYLRAKAKLSVERKGGDGDNVTTREENSALAKALAIAPDEPDDSTMGCLGALLVLVSRTPRRTWAGSRRPRCSWDPSCRPCRAGPYGSGAAGPNRAGWPRTASGRTAGTAAAAERSMSLQEFRTRVWSAGGYGDLAVRHPAV